MAVLFFNPRSPEAAVWHLTAKIFKSAQRLSDRGAALHREEVTEMRRVALAVAAALVKKE